MSEDDTSPQLQPQIAWWRSIGPGIITASVVFGPGSLLTSSKVGATYQYDLLWVLLVTAMLMATYTVIAARIGTTAPGTPCQLVARYAGRPLAVLIGVTLCLICGAFQFGNNLAAAAALDSLGLDETISPTAMLIGLNAIAAVFLFSLKNVYRWIERLMMVMVGIMLIAFLVNLLKARPDLLSAVRGILPSWPDGLRPGLPEQMEGKFRDDMILLVGLIGTTFSVAAAFYQATLVREKGWTQEQTRRGIADAIAGICVLTCISALIMMTSAAVLVEPPENIGQLARQLEPLFGHVAHILFCLGMLAAALSSFLVNAMIGGTILADGMGLKAQLKDPAPKIFTGAVLIGGMIIAIIAMQQRQAVVNAVIVGQATTVIGNPLLAGVLLWLANHKDIMGERRNRWQLNLLGCVGLVIVLTLALRTAYSLYIQLS
jgi:Mn2+/Fe2+ NRAMP family transporter